MYVWVQIQPGMKVTGLTRNPPQILIRYNTPSPAFVLITRCVRLRIRVDIVFTVLRSSMKPEESPSCSCGVFWL